MSGSAWLLAVCLLILAAFVIWFSRELGLTVQDFKSALIGEPDVVSVDDGDGETP